MSAEIVVRTDGLARRFGTIQAVAGVDLEVRRGEVFGFLGPNGAGKSTTIRMLCTLLRPSAGHASVAGFDVAANPAQVRAHIGLVFQDTSLDEQLSARENLAFHAAIYGMPARASRPRIEEMLRCVGLEDRADSLVRTFSGGMKRRLEIARGVLHTPQVLFLDEPTIGLDPQTRRHIWSHLDTMRHNEGVTLFMTTHYMDEAEHCDRIAIIDHGRIQAVGTPDELKRLTGGGDAATRPSLDDVFMNLTGRAIREGGADTRDAMRAAMRRRAGRAR